MMVRLSGFGRLPVNLKFGHDLEKEWGGAPRAIHRTFSHASTSVGD